MNELIPIHEHDGMQAVSARELHTFLGLTERFSYWFDRMKQYGFMEGVDYQGCKVYNTLANQELTDYALSLDCAKEISMLQRNERGKQARLYFIEVDKRFRQGVQSQLPQTFAQALRLAAEQSEQLEAQKQLIATQAPKALFADAVVTSRQSCLIGELAKILRQNGIEIGQNRLFTWLRNNNYLCQYGERYNLPTQRAMDQLLFEVKKTSISRPDGTVLVTSTPKVTGHGQIYFVNKFIKQPSLINPSAR